jgi:hypothetical protein
MKIEVGHEWLMPIILAFWEAEIRRTRVQGQPGNIVHEKPYFQNKQSQMDWRCGSNGSVLALQV